MWHGRYSSSMVLVKMVVVAVFVLPHLCFGDTSPAILDSSLSNIKVLDDELAHLVCKAHGDPVPVVTWTKEGTNITSDSKGFKVVQTSCSNQTTSHLLVATTSKLNWEGKYTCAAQNSRGKVTKNFKIGKITEVEEKKGLSGKEIISICIGLGLGLLIILSIIILIWRADIRLKEAARRAMHSRRNQGHENLAEDIQEIDAETNTKL